MTISQKSFKPMSKSSKINGLIHELEGFKCEMAISDLKPLISDFLLKTPTRCPSGQLHYQGAREVLGNGLVELVDRGSVLGHLQLWQRLAVGTCAGPTTRGSAMVVICSLVCSCFFHVSLLCFFCFNDILREYEMCVGGSEMEGRSEMCVGGSEMFVAYKLQ